MSEHIHLPVIEKQGTIQQDGTRRFVHPADVKGRFTRLRYVVFAVLIGIYLALPFVQINGRPAVFLDVPHRRFFLFGASFNAQDFWLVFFLLSGTGFLLFLVTTLLGRVWCGYACPQTVFLEGIYRRVERLLEGPAQVRIRRNAGSWNLDKIWRKTAKHGLFIGISLFLSHFFLSYFVSLPSMWDMMRGSPAEHPAAFAWSMGMSGLLYLNFAWFREQLCLIVCPYGRLQSLLTDDDTMVIGYDEGRGEPRGKVSDPAAADCIDCRRCVAVCPTGIDIRNGLQIECIGCAACIDACDEIMDKVQRPRGLIRYDSLNGLAGAKRRFLRPRLGLYAVLGVVGLVVAIFAFRSHEPYEANLLRLSAAPYVVEGERVRNSFHIHLVNKRDEPAAFTIDPVPSPGLQYTLSMREVTLKPLSDLHVPVFVQGTRGALPTEPRARVVVTPASGEPRTVEAAFVGPRD